MLNYRVNFQSLRNKDFFYHKNIATECNVNVHISDELLTCYCPVF